MSELDERQGRRFVEVLRDDLGDAGLLEHLEELEEAGRGESGTYPRCRSTR